MSRASQSMVSSMRASEQGRVRWRAMPLGHQLDELGVVVEHLLEMRDEPAIVDGVAGKAAAEVIIDAALGRCCAG